MSDRTFHGLTAPDIRELLLRGHTTAEIAAMQGTKHEALSDFMSAQGITRTVELHDKPPRPQVQTGKLVTYHTAMSAMSGHRRISRVSLPAISMQVREIEGSR